MAERKRSRRDNPSGVRPGREDMRATNVPVGRRQPLVRGHSEADTGDASGVRPGGEDMQAANVPVGRHQPLVRGHPDADTDHCCSCRKYLGKEGKHCLSKDERAFNYFHEQASHEAGIQIERTDFVCHAC